MADVRRAARGLRTKVPGFGLQTLLDHCQIWCVPKPAFYFDQAIESIASHGGKIRRLSTSGNMPATVDILLAHGGIGLITDHLSQAHCQNGSWLRPSTASRRPASITCWLAPAAASRICSAPSWKSRRRRSMRAPPPRRSDRFQLGNARPAQQARLGARVRQGAVHACGVVPHDQIVHLPCMRVDELPLRGMFGQLLQQCAPCSTGHPMMWEAWPDK